MKLSVIMPMYNAVDIKKNINEASKSLTEVTNDFEIILVDDGSSNGCLNEARSIKNRKLKVIGYKKNAGKGRAIKYGFDYAKGKYVAFLDCGQDLDPKQLKLFLKIIESKRVDIVIGSKRHKDSKVRYPLFRKIMSLTYQIINSILFDLKVKDTQVGIKLFKCSVLKEVMPRIAVKRFAFDLELLVIANKLKYRIVEAPIIMRYRFNSSINVSAVFWILLDTAAIFYRLRILRYYG